jgi:glutamate synthase domain-containing protein 1
MMHPVNLENKYGDDKVYDACGLFGIMDTTGKCFSGHDIVKGITNMKERGNGLGSGFAAYGCYPQFADCYAFHVMYTDPDNRELIETRLKQNFVFVHQEEVPHNFIPGLTDAPLIWRYFLSLDENDPEIMAQDPAEYVVSKVMEINIAGLGAYIYSSGKNMGSFKGVGLPDQIADYFGVVNYEGYLWTAHNRFPTNTPGWWGGAHPFGLLDWTVVHNGEISSYGTNRRFLEMQGYHCTMSTDTEVMAYAVDFLIRRHGLPVEIAAKVLSAPLWEEIERMPPEEKILASTLRQVYSGLLINGPFTVIVARQGEMVGLTDRIRLRPMVAATRGDRLYLSSEEASIRLVDPELEQVWTPIGGDPIIGRLGELPRSKRRSVQAQKIHAAQTLSA